MINRLRNMLSQVIYAPVSNQRVNTKTSSTGYNPFENPSVHERNECEKSDIAPQTPTILPASSFFAKASTSPK